jgi:hypothetical protein
MGKRCAAVGGLPRSAIQVPHQRGASAALAAETNADGVGPQRRIRNADVMQRHPARPSLCLDRFTYAGT